MAEAMPVLTLAEFAVARERHKHITEAAAIRRILQRDFHVSTHRSPTETFLQVSISDQPDDQMRRLVLADHLSDIGDAREAGYRAIAAVGFAPRSNEPGSRTVSVYRKGAPNYARTGVFGMAPVDRKHELPSPWFTVLVGSVQLYEFRIRSRTKLEDRIALAWLFLSADEQRGILSAHSA